MKQAPLSRTMKHLRNQGTKKSPRRDVAYDMGLVLLGTTFGISGGLVANMFDRFFSHYTLYDLFVSLQFALLVYILYYNVEKMK